MKLKNKKTGEIVEITMPITNGDGWNIKANSLAEICEEWSDYKEEQYVIDMWEDNCIVNTKFGVELSGIERAKECGLYFETRKEAELAVEKLKALAQAKRDGLNFSGWYYNDDGLVILANTNKIDDSILETLFGVSLGGEE